MKKLVTILMLVAVLFVGGATIDAKTTKKKAKAKTSLNILHLVKHDNRGYYIPYNLSIIKSHGYKYLGEDMWGDAQGNELDIYNYEGITEVSISFKNIAERDKFLKGWQKLFMYENGIYIARGAHDAVIMKINGTNVKIYDE